MILNKFMIKSYVANTKGIKKKGLFSIATAHEDLDNAGLAAFPHSKTHEINKLGESIQQGSLKERYTYMNLSHTHP